MKITRLICWMLMAAFALSAAAVELTPRGPEFVVNQHTRGFQTAPDLASLGTAGMVAVWMDDDDAEGGIKARLLDTMGIPVSAEFWVERGSLSPPRVAGNGSSLFIIVWADSDDVWGRLYLRDKPQGDTFRISPPSAPPRAIRSIPDVAMDAAGNFVAVWYRDKSFSEQMIVARRFGPNGQPAGDPVQVKQYSILDTPFNGLPRVALHDNGSFLVTWQLFGAYLRRFDGPSQSWGEEISFPSLSDFLVPVLYPEGDGAVVWVDFLANKVWARRLSSAGGPVGPAVLVGSYSKASVFPSFPEIALDKAGNALVVWPGESGITGRLFDRSWQPLSEETPISLEEFEETDPVAAASPSGGFVTLWSSGAWFYGATTGVPPPPSTGRDGDVLGIAGRSLTGVCAADAETLCLGPGGRFAARVSWKRPSGEEGVGHPLALTRDTGAFWFFGAENLELMVKVLDGRGVNGNFWVYAAALSDVEYTLVVRDMVTGVEKTYRNPPRQLASRADVDAFPASGVPSPDPSPVSAAAEALLLGDQQRFRIMAEFRDPRDGQTRQATAIPLTGDTGAFWFFDARNIELMIKVLDGRSLNGHFWVYYGALSDVRYKITVTDTVTGATKTYENTPGRLVSRADVEAF